MGRAPCCEKEGLRKGAWSPEEDQRLVAHIGQHGHPNWRALPKQAGLLRCGKSCRLRWINYLSPDIKRGNFTADEEDLVVRLHHTLGSRWSAIAAQLPGRTDNEIKNVWHTHIKKRLDDDRKAGDGGGRQQRKPKGKSAAAKAVDHEQFTASPGRSSSITTTSGVTCSTVTESAAAVSSSADNAATTSASHSGHLHQLVKEESFSSTEFPIPPIIDESFWSSTDVTGMMDLGGAMDKELSLTSSSSMTEDMEFWFKMLLEAGDMRDLTVL